MVRRVYLLGIRGAILGIVPILLAPAAWGHDGTLLFYPELQPRPGVMIIDGKYDDWAWLDRALPLDLDDLTSTLTFLF